MGPRPTRASGDLGVLQEMVGGIPEVKTPPPTTILPGKPCRSLVPTLLAVPGVRMGPCCHPGTPWGCAGWGGGHRPHGHPHQPTRVPAMRHLVERTKLLEPKIAPDAGRSGGSGGMCQGRSRLSTSTSPWQGTAPAGWDPAGAAIPVGSISGPRCSRLGLSLGPFRASVSPRSRWQARGPRGPFHHQLPLGYFRAGCSACAFFFSVPLPHAG